MSPLKVIQIQITKTQILPTFVEKCQVFVKASVMGTVHGVSKGFSWSLSWSIMVLIMVLVMGSVMISATESFMGS